MQQVLANLRDRGMPAVVTAVLSPPDVDLWVVRLITQGLEGTNLLPAYGKGHRALEALHVR